MKRGTLFASAGLILGLSCGLLILAGQYFAARELMKVLEGEVKGSCDCTLEYDSVKISFLTLDAVATNVRIAERGVPHLTFPRVEADFSLKHIRERKLDLTELRLIRGHSVGIGPQSTTFRFVDFLALPIPPERNTPDRWRLRLLKLRLINSSFEETVGNYQLRGEGAELLMTRQEEDTFALLPSVRTLLLKRAADSAFQEIGKLSSRLSLNDDWITLESINLTHGDSSLSLKGKISQKGSRIEADYLFQAGSTLLSPASIVSEIPIQGEGEISGTLGEPLVTGEIFAAEKEGFLTSVRGVSLGRVTSFRAAFEGSSSEGGKLVIPQLAIEGETLSVGLREALAVTSEKLNGTLVVSLDRHPAGSVLISAPQTEVKVAGSSALPAITARGPVDLSTAQGTPLLRSVVIDAALAQESLSCTLSTNENSLLGTFPLKGKLFSTLLPAQVETGQLTIQGGLTIGKEGMFFPLTLSPDISGPLSSPAQLEGQITLSSPSSLPLGFQGSASLLKGQVTVDARSNSSALQVNASLPLLAEEDARVELTASRFNFLGKESAQNTPCSSLSAVSSYIFSPSAPLLGKGVISLKDFSIGCAPHLLSLSSPRELVIDSGRISFPEFDLHGFDSRFRFDGILELSGNFDIKTSGDLDLAFMRAALSDLEDIRGQVSYSLTGKGSFGAPQWDGYLAIRDAGIELTSPSISVRSFNAQLDFDGDHFKLENARGIVNEGTFSMEGALYPFTFERSRIAMELRNVFLEPLRNATLELSSSLLLEPSGSDEAVIKGNISILSGEFNTETSIPSMLRSFLRSAMRAPRLSPSSAQDSSWEAPIFLDIDVSAPGDLVILSNWMGAELKANLKLEGPIANPQPIGTVEFLTGWLGLRDRRFEVSSGKLTYLPNSTEPVLEVLAETTLRSRQGDTILVFLEVSGTLSNPKISLTSDRGLTEREILALLTDAGSVVSQQRIETVGGGFEIDTLEFLEDRSYLGLGRLVRDLARIDSITLEPTFNSRTGVVEPSLVATKRLFDRLVLQAQSPLTSTANEATLRARFEATSNLEILASAETDSEKDNTALGLDASYIVAGFEDKRLFPRVSGNRSFASIDIVRQAKISELSRLRTEDLSIFEERIDKFYLNEGYFEAKSKVSCEVLAAQSKDICRLLRIEIEEGEPSSIGKIQLSEALPKEISNPEAILSLEEKTIASRRFRKNLERDLIARLRREGFIAARVSTSYESTETKHVKTLEVELHPGQPVTFVFKGNRLFSSAELLQTINLFGRKQPFGANTTSILLQNIERKYAEQGYLYTTVSVQTELPDEAGRKIVTLSIDEGPRTPVSGVTFFGLRSFDRDSLRKKLREWAPASEEQIFKPTVAIPEVIEQNELYLREFFASEGYTFASVSSALLPNESEEKVEIQYYIQEGPRFTVRTLTLPELPAVEGLPTPPRIPCSLEEANTYLDTLSRKLQDRGFLHPEITTTYQVSSGALHVHLRSGAQTFISEIEFFGMEGLALSEIQPLLVIKEGGPWDQDLLAESRRKLLQLALFSSVELTPADGALDGPSEKLTVKVAQRALQALSVGGGINSEYGLHIFGEAVDRSYFADGRSISARLDAYYDRAETEVSQGIGSIAFANPSLFDSSYGYVSDLRYQKLDLETQEFDLDRLGLSNYLHRSWDDGFSFSSGHSLLFDNLDNVSPDVILSPLDQGNVRLSLISGVLTYDQRNDRLNPEKGYNLSLDYLFSSQAIGSDGNFGGGTGKASFLYPLPWLDGRLSLASSTRLGSLWSFSDTQFVPLTQRYYIGGRTSVRGFRENSLGPKGDQGGVLGGDFMFIENFELRYRFLESLAAHVFLDAGGLYLKEVSISADDIRYSSGFGLRFLSPLGPIGFDLGIPLDEKPGEPSFRVHFSIGSNF